MEHQQVSIATLPDVNLNLVFSFSSLLNQLLQKGRMAHILLVSFQTHTN